MILENEVRLVTTRFIIDVPNVVDLCVRGGRKLIRSLTSDVLLDSSSLDAD